MEKILTPIPDLFLLKTTVFCDHRGSFLKTFSPKELSQMDLSFTVKESFYTISQKGVIRGMHFQLPPHDTQKIVYVSKGSINDVVLDLRTNSSSFGKSFAVKLKENDGQMLFIPKGFAHGFEALQEDSTVHYFQSAEYHQSSDAGVLFSSFNHSWETKTPLLSERDLKFLPLKDFKSPFRCEK